LDGAVIDLCVAPAYRVHLGRASGSQEFAFLGAGVLHKNLLCIPRISEVNKMLFRRVTNMMLFSAALFGGLTAARAQSAPDPARVAAIAKLLPATPLGVGRPIDDRKAWGPLAEHPAFTPVIRQAESYRERPIPPWDAELYLDFSHTGNRRRFERFISRRHQPLAILVTAECLENRGRFLAAIEAMILAIAEEKSWALPAHDRSLSNFRGEQYIPDLRSTAMAWQLATIDYWLGAKLSPELRQRIRTEVERRVLGPYRSAVVQGKPRVWWITGTNNWNAVCQAGTIGAALALVERPDERAFYVAAAEKNIARFLAGFTADGYCSEGLGYWNYGFGHYVLLAETVHQATAGRLDLLEGEKIAAIASFSRRLEILPGVYPAFADCRVNSRPDPILMAYLSRRFGWGLEDVEREGLLAASGPSRQLAKAGLMVFPNSASRRPAAAAAPSPPGRDWFAEAGVLICRPAADTPVPLAVALKGGHNAEHHNHNDVGSYVVALGGSTPLVDPGGEVYTARTFSSQRYESDVLNSFGHPVPRVAGQLQRRGRDAAARVMATQFTDTADLLRLDLKAAYAVEQLRSLQRTFVYSREGRGQLSVVDEVGFDTPATFETALITYSPWKQTAADHLVVGESDRRVTVHIDTAGAPFKVASQTIEEDVSAPGKPVRLAIVLQEPVDRATVKITISPADH
jgi:hypothetical protein